MNKAIMNKTSANILYRWNLLSVERVNLISLRNNSSGPENSAYRTLLQICTNEMADLMPQVVNIFKRVKRYNIMKDIIAIYFEDISYSDWAETRGVTVEELFNEVSDALEEIDREISSENAK